MNMSPFAAGPRRKQNIDVRSNCFSIRFLPSNGREPASVRDYTYSEAMKANKSAWTAAALDAYLADPRGDIHGAKMFFKGLPESRDRADVIAYLTSLK